MVQTAIALHELGVKISIVEGKPSILLGSARGLEAYKLENDRGFLGDTIGVIRMVRKTRSDTIFAFTDFFPETMVPCFFAALVTHKRLYVNVTSTAYRADDGRKFLGLIRNRVQGRPKMGPLLAFITFHASRRIAFRVGTCFVASHYVESYAKSRLHARRTFVVGAGVEEFWFERASGKKSYDGVYSGRFDSSKRVPVLIRAWQMVVRRKPDARLLLIGEFGDEFALVKRLVNELGLVSNVVFAGYMSDRRALADMVQSARVFVFPSVQEGFGLVIAEAMAAGLPCILSDVEPLREIFGEAALLVRPDDPSAFADVILGLLLDEGRRLDYATRSESMARKFSWSEVSKRVLSALVAP
jgi:glycosyltransferase involved in cell wall biosynthesis